MDNISTNMLSEINQIKFLMYPHNHCIMQVTSTQEGRTRIPCIARTYKASYYHHPNLHAAWSRKNLLKH